MRNKIEDNFNFGVTVNEYSIADAIADDKLFREMKSGGNVDLRKMQKQLNDLHIIALSTPKPKPKAEKTTRTKKPTQKEKLALILEKRALNAAMKNS